MSVHFKGQCFKVDEISCLVPCETKWRRSKPNLVLQGFCKELIIEDKTATIR